MKTTKIVLSDIKGPDVWGEVIYALQLSDKQRDKYFEFGEYASLELEVDETMHVVGRILPLPKKGSR